MKFYLAPLNKLGNIAFRELVFECGCDYVFSEMIRCKRLIDDDEVQLRKAYVVPDMQDRTILQIICEGDLSLISKSVHKLKTINPGMKELNYNMGCPQSSLCCNVNGAGIMRDYEKLKQVCNLFYRACVDNDLIPSVKIRIGISRDEINLNEVLQIVKDSEINKVYVHGRVLGESYSKPASYDEILLAKRKFSDMEIVGNGDVCDSESFEKLRGTGVDGVMIGRAALEDPCIFKKLKNNKCERNKSGEDIRNRKELILKYLKYAKKFNLSDSYIKANLSYLTKGCISGSEFRRQINEVTDVDELVKLVICLK